MHRGRLARRTSYHFNGNEFIKDGLDDLECELEKAERLSAVAAQCGFIAPRVVGSNAATRSMRLERVHGLKPYREIYLSHTAGKGRLLQAETITERVGCVLAQIHRHLKLSRYSPWDPPDEFRRVAERRFGSQFLEELQAAPQAILHGDFGFSNVCFVDEAGVVDIVIIDPSANGFMTMATDLRGPVYVDLANFFSCLEGLVPLRYHLRLRSDRLQELKSAFVRGYEIESGLTVDRALLERVSYLTATVYLRHRFGNPLLARLTRLLLFNSLKGNLP